MTKKSCHLDGLSASNTILRYQRLVEGAFHRVPLPPLRLAAVQMGQDQSRRLQLRRAVELCQTPMATRIPGHTGADHHQFPAGL